MEDKLESSLPNEFSDFFKNQDVQLCWESSAKTYRLTDGEGISRYLKIQPIGMQESLGVQAEKLLWLERKLSVPKVLDYGIRDHDEFLLTLEIRGNPASDKFFANKKDETIKLIASGLRTIHEVSVENYPYNNSLGNVMEVIQEEIIRNQYLKINNTNISAADVAKIIKDKFRIDDKTLLY